MLFRNTVLIERKAMDGGTLWPAVHVAESLAELAGLLTAVERVENVFGPATPAVRATLARLTATEDGVRCWYVASETMAAHLAQHPDKSIGDEVRLFAACLALGKPLPPADGPADAGSAGGGGGGGPRVPRRPVKPRGGAPALAPLLAQSANGREAMP